MDARRTWLNHLANSNSVQKWAHACDPYLFAGTCRVQTRNTTYLFRNASCFGVTSGNPEHPTLSDFVGMKLVGWLLARDGQLYLTRDSGRRRVRRPLGRREPQDTSGRPHLAHPALCALREPRQGPAASALRARSRFDVHPHQPPDERGLLAQRRPPRRPRTVAPLRGAPVAVWPATEPGTTASVPRRAAFVAWVAAGFVSACAPPPPPGPLPPQPAPSPAPAREAAPEPPPPREDGACPHSLCPNATRSHSDGRPRAAALLGSREGPRLSARGDTLRRPSRARSRRVARDRDGRRRCHRGQGNGPGGARRPSARRARPRVRARPAAGLRPPSSSRTTRRSTPASRACTA